MKYPRLHLTLLLAQLLTGGIGFAGPATDDRLTGQQQETATPRPAAPEQAEPKEDEERPVAEPAFNPTEEISEDLSVPFPVDI